MIRLEVRATHLIFPLVASRNEPISINEELMFMANIEEKALTGEAQSFTRDSLILVISNFQACFNLLLE